MYGAAGAVRIVLLGSFLGLVCALVFWRLAGRHLSRDHI
jgi:HAMP domain-containing protein